MIEEFVRKYIQLIALYPDDISIKSYKKNEKFTVIEVYVHQEDIGKVIGKNAHMVNAINTFIGISFFKEKMTYKAYIKDIKELQAI